MTRTQDAHALRLVVTNEVVDDSPPEPKPVERKRQGGITSRKCSDGITRHYGRFVDIDKKRRMVALGEGKLSDARNMLADIRARVRRGLPGIEVHRAPEPIRGAGLTVRALAELYKKEAQPDVWDLGKKRRAFWSAYSKNVDPYLGNMMAADVRRTDIAAWREKMKADGKTASTIIRGRSAASVMFNWALELGHLPDNAVNPIAGSTPPSYKPTKGLYSENEVASLLTEAAKNVPELHPLVAFAYFTGCRRGELAAVRWGDISFDTNSIHLHRSFRRDARKSGRPVIVGLHPHLRAILQPMVRADRDPADLVFPDQTVKKRRHLKPDAPNGWMRDKHDSKHGCWGLRDLAVAAKVKRLRNPWHGFRSSHATSLAEMGATPIDIMQALGQSDVKVAMGYTHATAKRAAERVAMLPSLGPVRVDPAHAGGAKGYPADTADNAGLEERPKSLESGADGQD